MLQIPKAQTVVKSQATPSPAASASNSFGVSSYASANEPLRQTVSAPTQASASPLANAQANLAAWQAEAAAAAAALASAQATLEAARATAAGAATTAANAAEEVARAEAAVSTAQAAVSNATAELATAEAALTAAKAAEAKALEAASCPQLADRVYASTLNGMTSTQLGHEKAAVERQIQGAKPGSAEHKALQQKLELINQEQKTRPSNFYDRVTDDRARKALQKEYVNKPTAQLETDLRQLFEQCSTSASGRTPSIESIQGSDTEVQKRISTIQAELARRGVEPMTPEKVALEKATAERQKAEEAVATAKAALANAQAALAAAQATLAAAQHAQANAQNAQANAQNAVAAAQAAVDAAMNRLTNAQTQVGAAEERVSFELQRNNAINVLWNNFGWLKGGDSIVSVKDLQKALEKNISPELRNAINFILNNSSVLHELDTAYKGGDADGKISVNDMKAILKKYGLA